MKSETYYYQYMYKFKELIKTNNRLKLLKTFHSLIIVLNLLFILLGLIIKFNSIIHYYILAYWLFILIHWIILKGECILDLFVKQIINKNYKMGSLNIFIVDLNYNKLTKTINKYNNERYFIDYMYIKLPMIIAIILSLYKINIPFNYKITISIISTLLLLYISLIQYIRYKQINNL